MFLREPRVEFIPIDLSIMAEEGSICPPMVVSRAAGGGQRCIASQEQGDACDDWDTMTPWSQAGN